jgi:hypothetical protein
MVKGDQGEKIGVTPKPWQAFPWLGPRPLTRPDDITEEEWLALSGDDEAWESWKRRDAERYVAFYLAGKAARSIHSPGTVQDADAKADYSWVQCVTPDCWSRLADLEQAAKDLMTAHWGAIGVVATQLVSRAVLTPEELEVLMVPYLS